jgi:hypothetical protein
LVSSRNEAVDEKIFNKAAENEIFAELASSKSGPDFLLTWARRQSMPLLFSVEAQQGLHPDPDENSAPIVTLDPSDLVSVDKTLDPWTKVTLIKAGLVLSGWLISAALIPVSQVAVELFDKPLGNLLRTGDGPR